MKCPRCGSEEIERIETGCQGGGDAPEGLTFLVCAACDYGINEHTEGECGCPQIES